jgi:hypothetical protein
MIRPRMICLKKCHIPREIRGRPRMPHVTTMFIQYGEIKNERGEKGKNPFVRSQYAVQCFATWGILGRGRRAGPGKNRKDLGTATGAARYLLRIGPAGRLPASLGLGRNRFRNRRNRYRNR